MRFDGILTSWNEDGGFGFIRPGKGGQDIFAHISAFPRDRMRPAVGEALSFEVEADADGKKRAKEIQRPHRTRASGAVRGREQRGIWGRVAIAAAMLLLAAGVVSEYRSREQAVRMAAAPALQMATTGDEEEFDPAAPSIDIAASRRPAYACGGRTHCSQVSSCAEATWVLENCPGTEMDGDRDGVPCEKQWCAFPG
ncbi:MAG: cold shock domain-containing protein [Telluria sp.]